MSSPIKQVAEEDLEKIRLDFREDPERLERYLSLFKEWLRNEKHLPEDIEDSYLENAIRLSKYDLEKAKSKFERYIIGKHGFEHLKSNIRLGKECFLQDDISRAIIIAPELNPDLMRTIYISGTSCVETFNYKWRQKYPLEIMEWFLHMGLSIGAGLVVVIDFNTITTQLITKLDFTMERRYQNLVASTVPARIKQIHFINVPSSAKPFLVLLKAVASEKIRKRMIMHSTPKTLKEYLSESTLPIEFGGTSGKSLEDWRKSWEEFYTDTDGIQEKAGRFTLNGEIPQDKAHLDPSFGFGADGSFRRLQLD